MLERSCQEVRRVIVFQAEWHAGSYSPRGIVLLVRFWRQYRTRPDSGISNFCTGENQGANPASKSFCCSLAVRCSLFRMIFRNIGSEVGTYSTINLT